ncbi:MAG: DUF1800 family protein, partial [Bdellovibrionales bacterium]|nr:DUF1800 family protein [Bdellovibrionales bacterium]
MRILSIKRIRLLQFSGLVLIIIFQQFLVTSNAFAAKKKQKDTLVENPDNLVAIQFQVNLKKNKSKTFNAHCYGQSSGLLKIKSGRTFLTSFESLAKKETKKANRLRGKKTKKKAKTLAKMYKLAAKISKPLCKVERTKDLDPYRGNFGPGAARILFDRFAFGATQEEIDRAVSEGLAATIERLTTYNAPASFVNTTKDLRCDGVINAENPDEGEICNAREINDVDFRGVRYDIYYRMLKTPTPYFEKIFLFLHDRIAASSDVLSFCERYALPSYVDLLRQHAKDGDYKKLVLEMILDRVMLKWLDGALSVKGNPNENFPREFWELFTIGTHDLNGRPLYGPIDIAESSRA